MTYGFIQDVPANAEIYALIKAKLGDDPAPGLIAHLAIERDGGLRYIDVWETEEAWDEFRENRIEPAVTEVLAGFGIPHDHSLVSLEPINVVDVWLGSRSALSA